MNLRKQKFTGTACCMLMIVVLLMSIAVGCDDSIDALDTDQGIYSIYGFVDVNSGVNYVRVKDLNIPLVRDTTDAIDATVTLTDLSDGTAEVLKDTIITFNNTPTHNFKIDMNIKPETTYRISAEGADGRSVSATATTPNIAEAKASPINENCVTPITISYNPVIPETTIQMQISFELYDNTYVVGQVLEASSGDGEELSVTITPGEIMIQGFCGNDPDCPLTMNSCYMLDSEEYTVDYTHYGPGFELGTDNSNISDSLQIPGGAGSFVGLLRDSFSFPIDTMRIGF